MRKRNVTILLRLDRKEATDLDRKVKKSGLNREAYLRQLIQGTMPKAAPPPDYYAMMRELHQIGMELGKIAKAVCQFENLDKEKYDLEVEKLENAVMKITNAVVLPEKISEDVH